MMYQIITALEWINSVYPYVCGIKINEKNNNANFINYNPMAEEINRCIDECTHTDRDGHDATIDNNDGTKTCPICRTTWNSNISVDEVNKSIDILLAAIQNVKLTAATTWQDEIYYKLYSTMPIMQNLNSFKNIKNESKKY